MEARTKTLGPTAEYTIATHNSLATALAHLNREAEREQEARGVLAAADGVLAPSKPRGCWVLRRHVIESTKKPDNFEATVLAYRSLLVDDQAFLGQGDLETLAVQQNLLAMLYGAKRPLDIDEIKQMVAARVAAQGIDHPDAQSGRWLLVSALMRANKFDEAEPILRELLAWNEKAGADLLEPWLFMGLCLGNNGKVEEGLAFAKKAREGYRSAAIPDESRVAKATEIIDQLETALMEELSKARGMKRSIAANENDKVEKTAAVPRGSGAPPGTPSDPEAKPDAELMKQRADAIQLAESGKLAEAEAAFAALVEASTGKLGADTRFTLRQRMGMAMVQLRWEHLKESELGLAAVFRDQSRVLGAEDIDTLRTQSNRSAQLASLGRYEEAIAEARAVLASPAAQPGEEQDFILSTRSILAGALAKSGRSEEAEKQMRSIVETNVQKFGAEHRETLEAKTILVSLLAMEKKYREAADMGQAMLPLMEKVLRAGELEDSGPAHEPGGGALLHDQPTFGCGVRGSRPPRGRSACFRREAFAYFDDSSQSRRRPGETRPSPGSPRGV